MSLPCLASYWFRERLIWLRSCVWVCSRSHWTEIGWASLWIPEGVPSINVVLWDSGRLQFVALASATAWSALRDGSICGRSSVSIGMEDSVVVVREQKLSEPRVPNVRHRFLNRFFDCVVLLSAFFNFLFFFWIARATMTLYALRRTVAASPPEYPWHFHTLFKIPIILCTFLTLSLHVLAPWLHKQSVDNMWFRIEGTREFIGRICAHVIPRHCEKRAVVGGFSIRHELKS